MSRHEISRTIIDQVVACDFCGKPEQSMKRCIGCGKDVCPSCGVDCDRDLFTSMDYGDYWQRMCRSCHEHAKPLIVEAERINREHDERIEEIENQWKALCKE